MPTTPCLKLNRGLDYTCITGTSIKYFQKVVIINRDDIDTTELNIDKTGTNCNHKVKIKLKTGKKGYTIRANETSKTFKGYYDKKNNEITGSATYLHKFDIFTYGVTEDTKCFMSMLDNGSYVVAGVIGDVVEIFGLENGIDTGDYTFDPATNGGASVVSLMSKEATPESLIPLIYEPEVGGDAIADFDSEFSA